MEKKNLKGHFVWNKKEILVIKKKKKKKTKIGKGL